jgi:hypothetical protein
MLSTASFIGDSYTPSRIERIKRRLCRAYVLRTERVNIYNIAVSAIPGVYDIQDIMYAKIESVDRFIHGWEQAFWKAVTKLENENIGLR